MRPPTPRATAPVARPTRRATAGAAAPRPAPGPRCGASGRGTPALMGRRRLGARVWHRLRRARHPVPIGRAWGPPRSTAPWWCWQIPRAPTCVDGWVGRVRRRPPHGADRGRGVGPRQRGGEPGPAAHAGRRGGRARRRCARIDWRATTASCSPDLAPSRARRRNLHRGPPRGRPARLSRGSSSDDPDVARFIKSIDVSEELVVITKRGRHALTLREDQVDDLLPGREPELDGLDPRGAPGRPPGAAPGGHVVRAQPRGRVAHGARLSGDDSAALRRRHGEHRRDAPPHRRHGPARVVPMAAREDAATSALQHRGTPRSFASTRGSPRKCWRATTTTSTASSAATSGTSRPRSCAACGAGTGPDATSLASRCSSTPTLPAGRDGTLERRLFTAYGIPELPLGLVGPTGAAAQRGGRLADVAQQGALLRPPRHPGDVGAG